MACAFVCAILLSTWFTLSGPVHARTIGISTKSSNFAVSDAGEDKILGTNGPNVQNLQLAGINANAYSYPTFNPLPGVDLSGVASVVNGNLRLLNGSTASGGYLLTQVPVAFYNFDRKVAGVLGTSFTYQFLNVSSTSRPGDGFTFIMTISKVARGRLGGDLGYANSGNDQCFAIEFDTYFNPEWDPNDNHIGFDTFGKIKSVATTANNTTPLFDIVNGGEPVYVWIQFWPLGNGGSLVFKIQVFISKTPTRPMTAVFEVNADMGQILSRAMGSNLYVGFTGASMGVVATIDISNWYFFSANLV